MWCLRGYYFKMAPGTVKKAIAGRSSLKGCENIHNKMPNV